MKTSSEKPISLKRGLVEPVEGEPTRYWVDSLSRTKRAQERYLVDLDPTSLGCGCEDWDYRKRPLWNQGRAFGLKPCEPLVCKHILAAMDYAAKWGNLEESAKALIDHVAIFLHNGKWLAGAIAAATPLPWEEQRNLDPAFTVTIRGRSGKTIDVNSVESRIFLLDSFDAADAYLTTLNQ
jgi:hypothetical protein